MDRFWHIGLAEAGNLVTLSCIAIAVIIAVNGFSQERKDGAPYPPRVRSWIPFLGLGIEMNANILAFLNKYRKKFPGEPMFTAHVAGVDCHFIVDVDHLGLPYKSIPELDDLQLQRTFMERVFQTSPAYRELLLSPGKNATKQLMSSNLHKYLLHTNALTKSIKRAQEQLDTLLNTKYPSKSDEFPLFSFVKEIVFCMSVVPLIGAQLNSADLAHKLIRYESIAAFLFAGLPSFLFLNQMKGMEDIYRIVQGQDFMENNPSDLVQANREALESDPIFHANTMAFLWAAVANSMPAVCWLLYYLLKDPRAFKAVQEEVQAIPVDENNPHYTLEELDSMVILQSTFTETLRLSMTAWKPSDVLQDFEVKLGTKRYSLKKGSRIMSYVSLMHMDPTIFESPGEFRHDRFLNSPNFTTHSGKSVPDPTRYVFGGGKHACSGRKFITYEAKAIVAQLLRRYNMELLPGTTYPGVLQSVEGVGVSIPKEEVYIRFESREPE